ncbi:glutathione S-transferase N-terminal domain-containing protein [Candidatus Woesearchaeota archaeon]|nr:glutathione S-transferase N-terminal domain-containing protein [Candidatus Woesearchaeota archaeon]
MAVKIYTTPTCPWCMKTKEFLKSKKIPYTEHNVVEDETARTEMIEKSGQMGVPVLDINGKIIVGYDPEEILKALSKTQPAPKKAAKKKAVKKR